MTTQDPAARILDRAATIKADALQIDVSRTEDVTAGDLRLGDVITRLGDVVLPFPFTLTEVKILPGYGMVLSASHGWFSPGPVPFDRPATRVVLAGTDEALADYVHEAWEVANAARVEHLRRCVARAARLVRLHLPDAVAVSVDVSECIPGGQGLRVTLVAVHDGSATIWHSDNVGGPLAQAGLDDIELVLTDALAFGVDQQVLEDAGWETTDGTGVLDVMLPAEPRVAAGTG